MKQPAETPRGAPGFVSTIPFQDTQPDCLIVCCSDHRFERQSRELATSLGFTTPHVVQVPSGIALTLPLATTFGFISRALDLVLERVIAMKKPKTVILIAHHDCGAYKEDPGYHALVGAIAKLLTRGKSASDLQRKHLSSAAKRLQPVLRGTPVRAFYASIVGDVGDKRVEYVEVF